MLAIRVVATSYTIIYISIPHSPTSAVCLLSQMVQPAVREDRPPGTPGVPLQDQPLGQQRCFCLQSGLLISPIHPCLPVLPTRLRARCSLSSYSAARPRWLLLREQCGPQQTVKRGRMWTARKMDDFFFYSEAKLNLGNLLPNCLLYSRRTKNCLSRFEFSILTIKALLNVISAFTSLKS